MSLTSAKPDETIFDVARSCLELFRSYLSSSRPSSLRIATEQQRFWAWSNTLKVFAKPHICLDAQLRGEKYDEIRRMVSLLLGVLKQNLFLALEPLHIIGSNYETSSGLSQSPETNKQPDDDALEVALFGIVGSVKRLERIAAVILQATQGSLSRRISAYAENLRAKEIKMGVENSIVDHITYVILYRFKAISPGLCRQLTDAFLYRHYRILYERSHPDPEFSRIQASLPVTEPSSQSYALDAEPSGPTLFIGAKSSMTGTSKPDEETQSEQTRPLTIDENLVREKLAEDSSAQPQPPSPPSVSETGAPSYPNPPHVLEGQKEVKCPICLKMFCVEEFEWHQWKLHVNKDIQPFVCISEDCSKNLQFFNTRQLWMNHMRKTHTSLWIRYLHNSVLWKCTLCGSMRPKYYGTEKELLVHMEMTHKEIEEPERRDIARSSRIPQPQPINVCPICGDSHLPHKRPAEEESAELEDNAPPPPNEETSEQKKKHRVQLVTSDDHFNDVEADLEPKINTAPEPSQETKDHSRIERYVGKHLQALAYYFSNRLMEDQEDKPNPSEGRNADASSSRLQGLPAVEIDATLPKFEYDEDPPKLPILYHESRLVKDDEVDLIEKNRRELLETWDWNDQGRVPEPGLKSDDLEQLFPKTYRQGIDVIWKGLKPLKAFEFAALIFLGTELCKQMISAVLGGERNGVRNRVLVPQHLTGVISGFVTAMEGFSEPSPTTASSGYVRAVLNLAVESCNAAKELLLLTSSTLVNNKLEDLDDRALEVLGDRARHTIDSLRFKLMLARIHCNEESYSVSEKKASNQVASSTEFGPPVRLIMLAIVLGDNSLLKVVEKQANLIVEEPGLNLFSNNIHGNRHWSVPRSVHPLFTGRTELLLRIQTILRNDTASLDKQKRFVITGLGGQGKSEICLQVASLMSQQFWGVFWIDVCNPSTAEHDFAAVANLLGHSIDTVFEALQVLTTMRQSWLLILDNADDPDFDYQVYFPPGNHGAVLMTSRVADCKRYSPDAFEALEGLEAQESKKLLLKAANVPLALWAACDAQAEEVVRLLGSHTLALIQAGAYIDQGHCQLHQYPEVYRRQRQRLMQYRPRQAQSRYCDVYATFEASINVLEQSQSKAASDALCLLEILSMLDSSVLPVEVFQEAWEGYKEVMRTDGKKADKIDKLSQSHVSYLPDFLGATNDEWDLFRLTEASSLLNSLSLVNQHDLDGSLGLSMHPLAHAWAKDRQDLEH